jgi:energy-coupling factor transport system ATP-binding protein
LQHPESQVLGSRVADDVVWGLPAGHGAEVGRLLAEVGLDGLADRDTGGLSAGNCNGWPSPPRWRANRRCSSPTK